MHASVDLAAAISLLPTHDRVPDVTGGLGTAIYDSSQTAADTLIRAVVNGINLAALAQSAGADPKSLVTGLLADLPANLLPDILSALALQIPVVKPVVDALTAGGQDPLGILTGVLNVIGVPEITDGTLTGLLALLGLNLSDPLNLSGLAVPGLNVVTAGPTFTALKLLGVDLGWVPSLPNSVASEINGSDYLKLGVNGVLNLLLTKLQASNLPVAGALVGPLVDLIKNLTNPLTTQLPDAIDVRVVPTVGIGLGAFAAATAYEKVLADLAFQPGGLNHAFGDDPILGSLTILPLVLINNPARPNGGAFARFGSLAAAFGINTVNPTTTVTHSGDGLAVGNTGISLGAANLLPVLVDATYEYQPLSDLAAWPNAVSLLNNLAAGLSPTYLLRGLSLDGVGQQVLNQVGTAVGSVGTGPLALNVYLTLPSRTLPLLEPLYLASDFLNVIGLGALAAIPMKLANALAPALSTLVNIGYTDVTRDANGNYTRSLSTAATETPFLSFPDIDYGKVPGDVIGQLVNGFTKEFFSSNPTPGTPNVLANLLGALFGGGATGTPTAAGTTPVAANPLGALGDLVTGALGGVTPSATATAPAALPSTTAKLLTVATPVDAATPSPARTLVATATDATGAPAVDPVKASATPATPDVVPPASASTAPTAPTAPIAVAAESDSVTTDSTSPKHAKPDDETAPAADSTTPPKHAKPDTDVATDTTKPAKVAKPGKPALNVVRDSLDASKPKDEKPGGKAGASDAGKKDEPTTATAPAASATSAGSQSTSSAAGSSEGHAA